MAIKSAIALLITSFLLAFCAYYYHGKYAESAKELQLATDTIKDMQTRQRDAAILDAKYTKELSDAKETIDQLQSAVASGAKRLRVNATCKPKTGTSSVGDESSAGLTYSAQRDYFTLRQRINTVTGQVNYLQEYIRTQCLR